MNRIMLKMWMFVLVAFSMAAGAEEPSPRFNQIHFQVQRERAVENDRMQAVLAVTAEDQNPANAADRVNKTMAWALKIAKGQSGVEVRSGAYQTQPIYTRDKITGWRTMQELILESTDFARLGQLIGSLQERMQMTAVAFSVSPQRRATVEDELIAQALDAFQQRAELVRRQLKAARYHIVDANVDTGGVRSQPILHRSAMASTAAVAPPVAEAGTSTVTVTINGTIELPP